METSKKNKRSFTKEDIINIEKAFSHLEKDHKCNEVLISNDGNFRILTPIKILETITDKIEYEYGSFKIRDILGDHFFDCFVEKKRSSNLKQKHVKSIDISKDFIRFNLDEEE